MPVQFLSDEQARRYGSFHGDPSAEQLSRFFTFRPTEQEDINRHRDDRARLGYSVQLGRGRFLSCFTALAWNGERSLIGLSWPSHHLNTG